MKRKALIGVLGSLLLFLYADFVFGTSVDVLLTPKGVRGPSKAVPLSRARLGDTSPFPSRSEGKTALLEGKEVVPVFRRDLRRRSPPVPLGKGPTVDRVLSYDTGAEASYLTGLQAGFHLGVWFESPAACTLLEIYYDLANGGAVTYYVADPADTIDFLNDYYEYHGGPNPSGPDPRESYLHPEESQGVVEAGWDSLDVTAKPDVGTDVFYAAYIMDDGNSNPVIDASVSPPYRTLMYRIPSGGSSYGWYTSYHHVYVRALVRMYENPPPLIEDYDQLPDTYLLTGREVTAHLSDLGIPLDSTGVVEANLCYWVNRDTLPPDTLEMTLISGTSGDGVWKAILPPASAGDEVEYFVLCKDMQGLVTSTELNSWSYTLREKVYDVLFVNDDYYGGDYSFDAVSWVEPETDHWDVDSYGIPDASVILAGYDIIIWNTWDGSHSFVPDTLLIMDYLDGGGNLFISSLDLPAGGFGYAWGAYTTERGDFCHDYLRILGGVDDAVNPDLPIIYYGVPGDPITDVFCSDWPVTSNPYYFVGAGYNYAGSFAENPEVDAIFYDLVDPCSGYRFFDPGKGCKVVFLYWPFAYIEDSHNPGTPDVQQQLELVGNILTWMGDTVATAICDVNQLPSSFNPGPYLVQATLTNYLGTIDRVDLIYSTETETDTLPMVELDSGVDYQAYIPDQLNPTGVYYYVEIANIIPVDPVTADTLINHSQTFAYYCGSPDSAADVMYVNDSAYPSYFDYSAALDSVAPTGGYDTYITSDYGMPDNTIFTAANYPAIIWNGDWGYETILTKASDTNILKDYLDGGGRLVFGSDEILGFWDGWADVDYVAGDFPYDYLHIVHIYNDIGYNNPEYDTLVGVAGDTITDGFSPGLVPWIDNWSDELEPATDAIVIFTDTTASSCRGLRYDGAYRVVFLPFTYTFLGDTDQAELLSRILDWFGVPHLFMAPEPEPGPEVEPSFVLLQNWPNPVNGSGTTFSYELPARAKVSLNVYNLGGQLIKTLVDRMDTPGIKMVEWDGTDNARQRVASGVYFYRMVTEGFDTTKKMVVLR